MTKCTLNSEVFPGINRKKIAVDFNGGHVSSDGGVLLVQAADKRLGLTERIAKRLEETRSSGKIVHSLLSMLRQRVYGIACGYEDGNDHSTLRYDTAFQTAVSREDVLASSATLHRFEQKANRRVAIEVHREIVETFIQSFSKAPKELILDFDATDDIIHGNQEGKFYHGYYGNYCFLPLYVFCGHKLLVSYLRPSHWGAATHSWAILSLLVKRFKKEWPGVKVIFRGDGGFCRHQMLAWCDRQGVGYIVGTTRNNVLAKRIEAPLRLAEEIYEISQQKVRLFYSFQYRAKSWKEARRVIAKVEHTEQGSNPRFIVTNLPGSSKILYDTVYCARGNMENRIKEQQLELFSDRTSCSKWGPNQLRLLFSSLAYVLMEAIRDIGLEGTKLAHATVGTIRLKLLKIGTVMTRNTRTIHFRMASHYPFKELFMQVANRLLT